MLLPAMLPAMPPVRSALARSAAGPVQAAELDAALGQAERALEEESAQTEAYRWGGAARRRELSAALREATDQLRAAYGKCSLVGADPARLQQAEADLQVRDAEIAALKLVAGIPSAAAVTPAR